jgi:hypothetical protein
MADLLEDLILDDEQISSMISRKDQLEEDHTRYLRAHPELKQVLNDFVTDCLLRRPGDVIAHASHYFSVFAGTHVPPPPEESMLRPIVLCGPSGVGKGTLIARLMKEFAYVGGGGGPPTRQTGCFGSSGRRGPMFFLIRMLKRPVGLSFLVF